MSMASQRSMAARTIAWQSPCGSRRPRSARLPASVAICFAVFLGILGLEVDAEDTRALAAKSSAAALPLPHARPRDPAPVTMATLPSGVRA